MKKIFLIGTIVCCFLTSCGDRLKGEGAIVTQSFEIEDFDTINAVSISNEFTLCFSDDVADGQLQITTYENVLGYIDVEVSGTKLSLSIDSRKIKGDLQLFARMKTPIAVDPESDNDSNQGTVDDSDPSNKFDYVFEASGGSTFYFENNGVLPNCCVALSGSSHFLGYNLTSNETLWVDISGNSMLQITANGTFSGSCSGGSSISYKGSAIIDIDTSGNSSIVKSEEVDD
ncbi:MAG: DUF2807 domain-containing protein [Rikenellaceae bacterium]